MGSGASKPALSARSTAADVARLLGQSAVKGKVVLITGGNAGLGWETGRVLAECGAHVILACRSASKANDAVARLQKAVPGASVKPLLLDLADLRQVQQASDEFLASGQPLHILINNAGVMACPFDVTKDGWEVQFGTNHL